MNTVSVPLTLQSSIQLPNYPWMCTSTVSCTDREPTMLFRSCISSLHCPSTQFSKRVTLLGSNSVVVLRRLRRSMSGTRVHRMAALQDGAATAAVVAGAYVLVYTFDKLTERQIIEQKLSRKVVHILSGILFMSSWPIFSSSAEARYYAAIVPLLNCARLVVYGNRLFKDEALIKSVTREGNPEELLRGPLYYVMVLLVSVLVFWRDSPVGIISLAIMCGGDGFADIIGRTYGSAKLPYNSKKSWIGSISMFVSGFLLSMGMLYYFSSLGYLHLDWNEATVKVALVSFVATLVESLPITDVLDDNISVPIASMGTALAVFGSGSS